MATSDLLPVPIAFFIFKRPDTTRKVVEAIASARPVRLLLVADGPRNPGEAHLCALTRSVVESVSWECDVLTNYSDGNLGLKERLSSGLAWVFDQVEEAIILEDDCLPHPTFFRFCQELLSKYRDNPRIMHISGNNFLRRRYPLDGSYYFTRYPHVWGWATWKRAWQHYDVQMTQWIESVNKNVFLNEFSHARERNFWRDVWDRVSVNDINTWDYQWTFACISSGGLAINPCNNLVSNLGFGADATHTVQEASTSYLANLPVHSMSFPLKHPPSIFRDVQADNETAKFFFVQPSIASRMVRKARRAIAKVRRVISTG
jgi:hypothetical protein